MRLLFWRRKQESMFQRILSLAKDYREPTGRHIILWPKDGYNTTRREQLRREKK